jgi:hypothetical protein
VATAITIAKRSRSAPSWHRRYGSHGSRRRIIHDLETPAQAQFLISTHSPIILSYPGAVLFSLDGDSIREIAYRETEHYRVTRDFLNSPERYFKHLLRGESDEEGDA